MTDSCSGSEFSGCGIFFFVFYFVLFCLPVFKTDLISLSDGLSDFTCLLTEQHSNEFALIFSFIAYVERGMSLKRGIRGWEERV